MKSEIKEPFVEICHFVSKTSQMLLNYAFAGFVAAIDSCTVAHLTLFLFFSPTTTIDKLYRIHMVLVNLMFYSIFSTYIYDKVPNVVES